MGLENAERSNPMTWSRSSGFVSFLPIDGMLILVQYLSRLSLNRITGFNFPFSSLELGRGVSEAFGFSRNAGRLK